MKLEHFHKRYSFTKTGRWGKVWPCERSLFQSANESSTFTNRAKAPLKLLSSPVSVWRGAVRRVRQHFKTRGTLEPQTHLCGRKTLLTARRKTRLQKLVAAQPDATLAELGTRLDRPFGTSTVDLWLRRLGLSYKKNAARRRAASPRRGRTKGALARTTGGGIRHPARVRG